MLTKKNNLYFCQKPSRKNSVEYSPILIQIFCSQVSQPLKGSLRRVLCISYFGQSLDGIKAMKTIVINCIILLLHFYLRLVANSTKLHEEYYA